MSRKSVVGLIVFLLAAAVAWGVWSVVSSDGGRAANWGPPEAAPVAVAPVEIGRIVQHRTFAGTLQASAEFTVSPKVPGRLAELLVDLADTVTRGQVVARLDDAEYVEQVAQAEAERLVAEARLTEARNALEVAERDFERIQTLETRGLVSDSEFDAARADMLEATAQVAVAEAQLNRAASALAAAEIERAYTEVRADWRAGDEERVVAARYVDEGDRVSANAELLRIVELDPLTAVIFVTERDYARLAAGQTVALSTDAFPGETFTGEVARVAPVFREASRQARVELVLPNPDHRLKPGMFVRAKVALDASDGAQIVPLDALTRRDEVTGVFLVPPEADEVQWKPVTVGLRDGERVQIVEPKLDGRVVTLGHQLVDDGAKISIPADRQAEEDEDDETPTS